MARRRKKNSGATTVIIIIVVAILIVAAVVFANLIFLYYICENQQKANMKEEIVVTADKRVSELMKEFNEVFSFLRLRLYTSEARLYIGVEALTPYREDIDSTIGKVRVKKCCDGVISIDGSKSIGALEAEFYNIFGLVAQVCYTTAAGENIYTYQKEQDQMTLSEFNAHCEAEGCIKGEWR